MMIGPVRPARVHRRAVPAVLPRLSGCTVTPDGGPLTTEGHERIRRWRQEWLAGTGGVVPALSLPDGNMLTGPAALAHLADLADLAELAELAGAAAEARPRARARAAAAVSR